jgi:hypothetical protein
MECLKYDVNETKVLKSWNTNVVVSLTGFENILTLASEEAFIHRLGQ